MALDGYHSKLGLCRTKNSRGNDFDSHTHAYTPTLPKTSPISTTIKSKFNFKNIFSDIVYNVENEIDFAKNRGPATPGSATVYRCKQNVTFLPIQELPRP